MSTTMSVLLTLPTHNEAIVIEQNIRELARVLPALLPNVEWSVLIADNASTDTTRDIVARLTHEFPWLSLWHTEEKGRGNALRKAWLAHDADLYLYMDADLATSLTHIPELIASLDQADLATGSRFVSGSQTERSWWREFVSRAYRWIVHQAVPLPVQDVQCGFKAIRKDAATILLPQTVHPGWFFDTELIGLAHAQGFRVVEIPVQWKETRDKRRQSSVHVFRTAIDNLVQLWKLRKRMRRPVIE